MDRYGFQSTGAVVPDNLKPVLLEGVDVMSKVHFVLVLLNDLLDKINGFFVERGKFSSVSLLSCVNLGLDALVGALEA